MDASSFDVVVVGAGNAALCAALGAQQAGASVLVLERAPLDRRAGNAVFTGGLVRIAYAGIGDVRKLVPELGQAEAATLDVGRYTAEDFFLDLAEVTDYQADPELTEVLTQNSFPTMEWLRDQGVRFTTSLTMHALKSEGVFKFRGNAPVEVVGGGQGLSDFLFEAVGKQGINVWYESRATRLEMGDVGIRAVHVRRNATDVRVACRSVVLACGGFEANPEMRARYLGSNWDTVKVRGSEFNTGDGLRMALEVGAQPYGHWSGCHATPTDANAPTPGDRTGKRYERHSFIFGIMVNRLGHRFVDEASDIETHTYAKMGAEILRQPGRMAFQIFDAKTSPLLREEYRARHATRSEAGSLEKLAAKLEIDPEGLVDTITEFNNAVQDGPFDPALKDGKRTRGISPVKSNWALPIDTPPYVGYPVVCGITFTFGGLRINRSAEVLDEDGRPLGNVFAAGEIVGGLFYHNYPTATGITAGAVFGKIAGGSAGKAAVERTSNAD
jgi:tricarballylate dehydrogenase